MIGRLFNIFVLTAIIGFGILIFTCEQPPVVSVIDPGIDLQDGWIQKDTYVLIHGAWHGSWCWFQTETDLINAGQDVITVNLPGHGIDKTLPGLVTLNSYVETVLNVIDNHPGKVILVGHSAGGITISQVAEYRPEKIKGLVYLSAFLLRNGETALSVAGQDINSTALQHLIVNAAEGYLDIDRNFIKEAFYGECGDEYYNLAKELFIPEPLMPLATPLSLTAKYNGVKKYYIRTSHDKAITFDAQNKMLANTQVNKVYTLDGDHSSFFSQNHNLVKILLQISRKLNGND